MILNGPDSSEGHDISCSERPEKPAPCPSAAPSPSALGTGHIRGTLTYYFNANYGSKPDVGSQIWLMTGQIEIPSSAYFVNFSDTSGGIKIDQNYYCPIAHTIADGNGVFNLDDVQSGDYTLIIQSDHTKGGVTKWDLLGRVVTFPVPLSPGQTIDKSWDFGISTF